ncbi:flagellin [Rhizobium sp. TRM95111]|uniref:flagellin N-terminal helical domain-containing protein n=1 Tax=Rhizobium alarense TaxID=2846851 RepID=UPI001F1A1A23|nr:flagellin [Rhizobium alarense]MCF3639566.1 flagellin [Rhizobium alarense]
MTSILTNSGAMAALQTLRSIDRSLETTQARVSSGLRVETAADNAAYWSIATTMRSDNRALSTVQDALGLGAAKVDTAYAGMESAIEVVTEIRTKLVAATEEGVDKDKIQEEITQLQAQLVSIAEGASFSGENWLQTDLTTAGGSETKSVVASFVRSASGDVSVKKVDYTLDSTTVLFDEGGDLGILDLTAVIEGAAVALNVNVGGVISQYTVAAFTTEEVITAGAGASTFDGSYATDGTNDYVKVDDDTWVIAVDQTTVTNQEVAYEDSGGSLWAVDTTNLAVATTSSVDTLAIDNSTTTTQLDGLLKMVDTALESMTSAAADLGAISTRIEMQEGFVATLTDVIDSGIGRLVDADMNEESTRLKALQTQQQLAIQSLSIANTSSENILQLFRQ